MSDIVYNNQTAFNKIWAFAQDQNAQSSQGLSCVYNSTTESGEENHCWVGVLLEGIALSGADNSRDIGCLRGNNSTVRDRLKNCSTTFLSKCQDIHDNPSNWDYEGSKAGRLKALKAVAEDWGLKVPEETNAG